MVACPIEAAQCDAHQEENDERKNAHDSHSPLLNLLEGGKGFCTYSYHTSHFNPIIFLFMFQIKRSLMTAGGFTTIKGREKTKKKSQVCLFMSAEVCFVTFIKQIDKQCRKTMFKIIF